VTDREWYHVQRVQQEQQNTEKTQEGFTPPESVPIVSVNDEEDDFDEEEN
jgi:hypothetical protein